MSRTLAGWWLGGRRFDGRLRLGVFDVSRKDRTDFRAVLAVADQKRVGIREVETASEVGQFSFVPGQTMDLLVVEQLKRVLDFSQQEVSGGQLPEFISAEKVQISQPNQAVQRADAANASVVAAMTELQKLSHELDVAD